MEGGEGPRLRDFLSGSLATWALGLAGLVGESEAPQGEDEEEEGVEEEGEGLCSPEKRIFGLSDGALLLRVLAIIAPSSRGAPLRVGGREDAAGRRVQNLSQLWGRLRDFYQEELQLLILSPPPDLQTLGFDPLSEEALEELGRVLRLMLGAAVQCEHRELFIRHIQGLSLEAQSTLATTIQEVTQPWAGIVLALAGPEPGELTLSELEILSWSLKGTLSRLARERDVGAQRLADLLLEREPTPVQAEVHPQAPPEGPSHHLALQLANAKAQLRRLRQELEEKAESLLDSQAEVQGLEAELRKMRQKVQALAGQAKRADLYREEAEALRERVGRLPRLQEELRRCRERLQEAQGYKAQLEEERLLLGTLEASKALLEGQLEDARERCARLHESQRENLILRTRLGEAHAELDSLRHQVEQLSEENIDLGLGLHRSLEPAPSSPGEAPLPGTVPSLHDEVREAEVGRLRTLELENQELRNLLQALQEPLSRQCPLLEEPREHAIGQEMTEDQGSQGPAPSAEEQGLEARGAADHVEPQGPAECLGTSESGSAPQESGPAPGIVDSEPQGSVGCLGAPEPSRQAVERPLQEAAMAPQPSGSARQESGPVMETPVSSELAGHEACGVAASQSPEIKIQVHLMSGGKTEEGPGPLEQLVPGPLGLRQEGSELKPGPSGLRVYFGEQGTPDKGLDLSNVQTEARGSDQRPEGTGEEPTQQRSGDAPETQAREQLVPGEIPASDVPEQGTLETLREVVTQLRREAKSLQAELEAQSRRLEARSSEATRVSEELAQARRAEAEAHQEAQAQAQEQARLREALEAAGRELEASAREREALTEALAAAGRERRQWEREGPRLRARAEAAEDRLQALEGQGRRHLEEVERELQEKQALREELDRAVVRGQELGARLECLQRELEQAALERQGWLQEQECQHQRYQGLEHRLEVELQAAATSKEEALMELKTRAQQLEQELFQLRQGPEGQPTREQAGLQTLETQSNRLIEVERSNATLAAEKEALRGQLQHLEGQLGSMQGRAQELLLQSQRAQEHSGRLQAEKAALERQGQELHRRLGLLEEEVQAARRSQEETRGQQQALLRDHEALAQLQRRQEAELEGLLARHRDLKANMRALELAHRELQGRHEQLQAQRANLEAQELALLAERERLMQDGHRQRGLEEELRRLQSEHDRAQLLLAEVSRERGELQGERGELRGRLARLELERAQLEAQSQRLRESNQQLDLNACRLSTQCELLTQLRSAQEEENRQLLVEVQALSRENRGLLERSLESRDHLHREQREYLVQLNALRREKQKLVEKIMDQYRVLEPGPLPRTKKGSWLADKVKRLMRPRREGGPHMGPRLGADGTGNPLILGGPLETELPEGREADGTGLPSPAPIRRAQSSLCLGDVASGQRRKLSSRFPIGRSSESFSPGDTPRQRFRQRRPGPLGAPSSQGKGPGVEWDGSVETLAEHEVSVNREGPEEPEPEKRPLAASLSQ
ncbi:coiled-coil domain-containing protein 88B [Tenrec ecaudatus]|uniref:coiled-coil domain-containing protein 88B n=1 Tax=Tenrec ecaudatus TaxID=94439 RepID=UPI003F591495